MTVRKKTPPPEGGGAFLLELLRRANCNQVLAFTVKEVHASPLYFTVPAQPTTVSLD